MTDHQIFMITLEIIAIAAMITAIIAMLFARRELDRALLAVELASNAIELASLELDRASRAIELASLELDRASRAIELASLELDRASNAIELDSLELDRASRAIELASLELDRASNAIELDSLAIELDSLEIERVCSSRASLLSAESAARLASCSASHADACAPISPPFAESTRTLVSPSDSNVARCDISRGMISFGKGEDQDAGAASGDDPRPRLEATIKGRE
ncbi:MAG: hypothetical protein LBU11_06270 [Zoogloeaceae bacterium]|jgi:hypothetical protein|nr:hypothetical protein [Zoogloeaceae bacterium]